MTTPTSCVSRKPGVRVGGVGLPEPWLSAGLVRADTLTLRDLVIRESGRRRSFTACRWAATSPSPQSSCIIDGISLADLHYAWPAAAEYFSGVNLLDAPDRHVLAQRVNEQWLPLMGTPGAYTERGRRYDSVLKYLMGGELPLRA